MWYIKLEKDNGSAFSSCDYSAQFIEKTPNANGGVITKKDDRLQMYMATLGLARSYKDKLTALKDINKIAIDQRNHLSDDGESVAVYDNERECYYRFTVTDDICSKKQKYAVHKKTTTTLDGFTTDEISNVFNVYYDACSHHGKVAADVVAEHVRYGDNFTLQHTPNSDGATVITLSETVITVYTERIEI